MRTVWLAIAFVVACRGGEQPRPPKRLDPGGLVAHGATFVVASESLVASQVGRDVLAGGGNAIDAAVATAFALAVVHPSAGNLGGGGFAVVHTKAGDTTLDFRETAPAAATADMFLDADGKPTKASLVGWRAAGVPGSVAGLWELHRKLGALPWRRVVAPALALARDGFVVDPIQHDRIERRKELLAQFPESAAIWLPHGTPRAAGERMTIPALADALAKIAEHGRDGFYTGEVADAIADAMTANGGLITRADLAAYQPIWRAPLRATYRGYTLVTMAPPSSGGIVETLAANMLGAFDLAKLGWHSTAHVHELVEVLRRAFAARNEILGDPAYVTMPVDKLISPAYARALAATITDRATPSRDVPALVEGTHTTNLCVVDGAGNAVALTTTINTAFGSGVTVHGFVMNNEMDDFASKPGAPNVFGLVQGAANKIEPGKRMLSSMSPTIALDARGVAYVAGAGGGPRIVTAVWQVLSNAIDFGKPIDAAVAAPRIHHQHLPDIVFAEDGALAPDVADELRALGYELKIVPGTELAAVTAIARARDGTWSGTADPRGGGGASGD